MARIKRIQKPKKIEFAIDANIHKLFEQLYLKNKLNDFGLTKGEFFGIIVKQYFDGMDAVKERVD